MEACRQRRAPHRGIEQPVEHKHQVVALDRLVQQRTARVPGDPHVQLHVPAVQAVEAQRPARRSPPGGQTADRLRSRDGGWRGARPAWRGSANSRAACVSSASRNSYSSRTSVSFGTRTRVPARARNSRRPSCCRRRMASATGSTLIPSSSASRRRDTGDPGGSWPRRIFTPDELVGALREARRGGRLGLRLHVDASAEDVCASTCVLKTRHDGRRQADLPRRACYLQLTFQ